MEDQAAYGKKDGSSFSLKLDNDEINTLSRILNPIYYSNKSDIRITDDERKILKSIFEKIEAQNFARIL